MFLPLPGVHPESFTYEVDRSVDWSLLHRP